MNKLFRRGFAAVLALIMVAGLLPFGAFAAVESNGRPKDVNNTLVLSIYTGTGFPGEPAVFGTENYQNFNSSFTVRSGATFANTATAQLDWDKIDADIVQGATSGSTYVWGIYDANGTKDYFLEDASIIQPANEAKMIRAIKTELKNASDEEVLSQYEIIWYVIKLQHKPRSGWFSSATTEWHIDGVIKERQRISINYYGNGNTSGAAPLGTANHISGADYTVLGKNTLVKVSSGVEMTFLGWSAKADGTGAEAGFYQPGDVINPTQSISLYAMWDTFTQHTATVRTYLDGQLMTAHDIHHAGRTLSLSTDEIHYYDLTGDGNGTYTTKITGNGKFHLYLKKDDGTYSQIGTHQLTIYNQNGSLDVHHYSVTYDVDGGAFETEVHDKEVYLYADAVTAIADVPTREGYRFLGWETADGKLIQPGEAVTDYIDAPITLTAKWEQTVNVTINVTINHKGGDGYDQVDTKDEVFMELVSRADDNSGYLETGDELSLSKEEHDGFKYTSGNNVTKYTATVPTYTDMPGGTVDYTVVTSKSGYDTTVEATQDANGDWIIDVEMTFNPNDFDLEFTVEVDKSVPDQYIPDAAIVKVTFWSNEANEWKIITQQEGNAPGVRVNIDPNTRTGSGEYPVWKYESGTDIAYGYRIEVTSFVYPDGTIVPASVVKEKDVEWTDNVYTATVEPVTDGATFGTQEGAYFVEDSDLQKGTLNAVITMDLHNVTFDAQGGTVNGQDAQTVTQQYKIPSFKDYVPVRGDGYTFGGWHLDQAGTIAATEGTDLTKDITLYAKWIDPLTISGTVSIYSAYEQNGQQVAVHDVDCATEAIVVLQEIRNGIVYDIDSVTVEFGDYDIVGSGEYSFTKIPNDGKQYQIHALILNYNTTYDNESDADNKFTATEYTAVFDGDNVADVDVYLEFVAQSYDQTLNVDATQISEAFRPTGVLSEVLYRDSGDNHPFQRISQHDVIPFGVRIALNTGVGSGKESIWKWHTDGTLYDYQMNVTVLYGNVEGVFTEEGTEFNSDTAPYFIICDDPVYWDAAADKPSGEMKATLIPKQYLVTFDLNAGEDEVTGMDAYWSAETGNYQTLHKWSFDTDINATPVREGYNFIGWQADVAEAYDGSKIVAATRQEVTLTAQWERIGHTVTLLETEGCFSLEGAGEYDDGATATVIATPKANYIFTGWYEDGEVVSTDETYSFTVNADRTLTAKFAKYYTITTIAETGGTVSGGGQFAPHAKTTLIAKANDGYYFAGWYNENNELENANISFELVVLEDRTFTAKFEKKVSYKCDYVYIFGYNDTEIGAEGTLLRGELAQMIYRLVKQNGGPVPEGKVFADTQGEWFQKGMSFMAAKGALNTNMTNAYPFASVTRGETYKMICLGLGFTDDANLSVSEYAQILFNSGYLTDDGRVTATIQRWEFCKLFNSIIGRTNAKLVDAQGNKITAETYGYTDLSEDDPYYEIMLRATSTYDKNGYVDVAGREKRNVLDEYGG